MADPAITEYSAIGLLILLAIIGWRLMARWLGGYNERQKERQAEELEERKRDYQDRQRMADQLTNLVAADIEAKKELETTLRALTAAVRRQQKISALAEQRAVERHQQICQRLDGAAG